MLDWMNELFDSFWAKICSYLPLDPFSDFIDQLQYGEISKYIGYINYFFPVKFLFMALGSFLTCLAVYYIYSISLRWIKAID